jgi:hypothetical protein
MLQATLNCVYVEVLRLNQYKEHVWTYNLQCCANVRSIDVFNILEVYKEKCK